MYFGPIQVCTTRVLVGYSEILCIGGRQRGAHNTQQKFIYNTLITLPDFSHDLEIDYFEAILYLERFCNP